MMQELVRLYKEGDITGYQLALDSLHQLDPKNPAAVLAHLPEEVLEEILAYARRYDPLRFNRTVLPPTEDRVRSAQRWIEERRETAGADGPKREESRLQES